MKQTLNPATYQQSEGACPASADAGAGLTACLLKNDPASASTPLWGRAPRASAQQVKWPHIRVREPWSRSESEPSEEGAPVGGGVDATRNRVS
jgi:hypothetical protein